MHVERQTTIQPIIPAVVVLLSTAGGVAGLCGWFLKGFLQSKDGWNGTPLTCLLLLCVSPVICAIFSFVLVRTRRKSGRGLTGFEWFALATGGVPIAVMGLMLMLVVLALILSRG